MRVVKLFAQQTRELQRFQGLLDGAHQLAIKVSARGGRGGLSTAHGERLGSRRGSHRRRGCWCCNIANCVLIMLCPLPHVMQVLNLQGLLDASSRMRNTL